MFSYSLILVSISVITVVSNRKRYTCFFPNCLSVSFALLKHHHLIGVVLCFAQGAATPGADTFSLRDRGWYSSVVYIALYSPLTPYNSIEIDVTWSLDTVATRYGQRSWTSAIHNKNTTTSIWAVLTTDESCQIQQKQKPNGYLKWN